MPRKTASRRTIKVNRAAVLTLWATVAAERLGFDCDEAFTLGHALAKDRPIDPASMQRYLIGKFGGALKDVHYALTVLARSRKLADLASETYALYQELRPAVPAGVKGLRALSAP